MRTKNLSAVLMLVFLSLPGCGQDAEDIASEMGTASQALASNDWHCDGNCSGTYGGWGYLDAVAYDWWGYNIYGYQVHNVAGSCGAQANTTVTVHAYVYDSAGNSSYAANTGPGIVNGKSHIVWAEADLPWVSGRKYHTVCSAWYPGHAWTTYWNYWR
jgi:hypothetical protein